MTKQTNGNWTIVRRRFTGWDEFVIKPKDEATRQLHAKRGWPRQLRAVQARDSQGRAQPTYSMEKV